MLEAENLRKKVKKMNEFNMRRFGGTSVVITGGGSGFGAAAARRFATEGANVLIADVDTAGGERVAADIEAAGYRALFQRTDV
ncbi:MAG: SDR family NAD(P)-dependent oxidoreductase, partial [Chromatiales bacterium]|nr:SDR family NAD(P)-dependent oxidoreductase [Chromatiales bacterium]